MLLTAVTARSQGQCQCEAPACAWSISLLTSEDYASLPDALKCISDDLYQDLYYGHGVQSDLFCQNCHNPAVITSLRTRVGLKQQRIC